MIYGIRPIDPSGRFHAIITVRDFMMVAYGAPLALVESQTIAVPAWARNDRFEIVAKVEGAFSQERFLAMMRTLLADRFRLRVRKETRQLPIYDLVLDRPGQRGPGLRAADGQCLSDPKAAAADLRREVQRHVRNRTGLTGSFDFDVEFIPEPDASDAAFFTAFREQLGLRFQPATGPLDAYVIERVEPPSPD